MDNENKLCRHGKDHLEEDYHSCPFAEEIHGDNSDDACNCCSECTYDCAMDI